MKTQKDYIEHYQRWYVFWEKWAIELAILILMFLIFDRMREFTWTLVIISLTIVSVILNLILDIVYSKERLFKKRENVQKQIVSLEEEIEKAKTLINKSNKNKDSWTNDWTTENPTIFKKYQKLQKKLFKKQAYLEMIGE